MKECSMKKLDFNEIYDLRSRNLKNVTRYSGRTLLIPESVSDHISDMVAMGLHIVEICRDNEIEIDKKDLIYRICVHDFDESILCDLPRNFKYYTHDFRNEVEKVVQSLLSQSFSDELINDINSSKSEKSFEGTLVHMLDIVQATFTLYREVKELGNTTLKYFLDDNIKYLNHFVEEVKKSKCLTEKQIELISSYVHSLLKIQ